MEFTATLVKPILDNKKLDNQNMAYGCSVFIGMAIGMLGIISPNIPILRSFNQLYFIFGGFAFPVVVILLQSLKNRHIVQKHIENTNQVRKKYQKHNSWDTIGRMVLTDEKITIEINNSVSRYFLKDVRNLEIKNEAEAAGRYPRQDPINPNKMPWKLVAKGHTNYISFVIPKEKSQVEKIRYNFLIRSSEHAEELYELFKIWIDKGVVFKR